MRTHGRSSAAGGASGSRALVIRSLMDLASHAKALSFVWSASELLRDQEQRFADQMLRKKSASERATLIIGVPVHIWKSEMASRYDQRRVL